MRLAQTILCFCTLCSIMACNKDRQWEEGDRNTFTWKGQLVKDCNGEPEPNKEVSIKTGGYISYDEDWEETIATGLTDENGYFSLTYKKIKRQNYGVTLVSKGVYLSAPSNQDIERDVAIETCDMIHFEIENISGADSVYIAIGKLYNSPYRFTLTLTEFDSSYKQPVPGIPLFKSDFNDTLFVKPIVSSKWNNEPFEYPYSYSTELSEVRKSILSYLVDSIPDGYNSFPIERSGYPVVDKVYIQL